MTEAKQLHDMDPMELVSQARYAFNTFLSDKLSPEEANAWSETMCRQMYIAVKQKDLKLVKSLIEEIDNMTDDGWGDSLMLSTYQAQNNLGSIRWILDMQFKKVLDRYNKGAHGATG